MTFTLVLGTFVTLSWMLYFTPYMVALGRGHQSTLAISMVNLFLGWFFVGWVVALVWACSNPRGNQPQIIVNTGSNATIIPNAVQNKARYGRFVILLALLATLGYLSAFAVGTMFKGIQNEFSANLSRRLDSQSIQEQNQASQATPEAEPTPEQKENQEELAQPEEPVQASAPLMASSTSN